MFTLTMDIYIDNPITGHHDKKIGRETKTFDKAEDMANWWDHNKSFEREGKAKQHAKKRGQKNLTKEAKQELGDKLVDDARRSVSTKHREAQHSRS